MASFAAHFGVARFQFEICLAVVIEFPQPPSAHIMTARTFAAESAFVDVIFLMTAETIPRRIAITRALVALGAFHRQMRPRQREAGQRMVIAHTRPARIVVAALAAIPHLALVLIVFFMTIDAASGRVAITLRILVATVAGDTFSRMAPTQGEAGFGVIEQRCFPARFGVAIAAFLTQRICVFIIFAVTTDAGERCAAIHLGGVAVCAFDGSMFSQKRESGCVVIEAGGFFPTLLVMALAAFIPEAAVVFVVFFVAAHALF